MAPRPPTQQPGTAGAPDGTTTDGTTTESTTTDSTTTGVVDAPGAAAPAAPAAGTVLHPGRAPFAAVLFDMDGTLVDSTPSVERCWARWAQEMGVGPERLLGWHGVPARAIARALLPAGRVEEGVARITELETQDTAGIVALPGALEALAALPPGLAAIATSCTRPLALARLAAAGVRAPAVVVTADDVVRGKPDPEPFLLAAQRLGVDPARCLVVEDAPAGVAAARAAGCASLGVTTTTPGSELDADVVVRDLGRVRVVAGADGVRVVGA